MTQADEKVFARIFLKRINIISIYFERKALSNGSSSIEEVSIPGHATDATWEKFVRLKVRQVRKIGGTTKRPGHQTRQGYLVKENKINGEFVLSTMRPMVVFQNKILNFWPK